MAVDVHKPNGMVSEWSRETTQILPPAMLIRQEESLAVHRWKNIRKYIRSAMTETIKTDVAHIEITHGVQFLRKMNHPQEIVHACYNRKLFEYLTNDGSCVRQFIYDGRLKDIYVGALEAERFVYIPTGHSFVAWKPGSCSMRLFNGSFQFQTTSTNETALSCLMYDDLTNQVVSLGKDLISFWELRFANRYLVLKTQFKTGLEPAKLELAVLESHCSRKQQRLFVAEVSGVVVFSVAEEKLLTSIRNMHVREITAIHWLSELRYLISGSRDGAVKLWSNEYTLLMTFSGHADAITCICTYPFDCAILTACQDRTIRVWSLETSEEVMKIRTDDVVTSIEAGARERQFCSKSKHWIELWNIQQVHHSFVHAGATVKRLSSTQHAHYDPRVIMQSSDGTVRIICPLTGSIVATTVTPIQKVLVHSTALLVDQNLLFVLFTNGELHKYKANINPCQFVARFVPESPNDAYTCIVPYHHIITKRPQQTSDIATMSSAEIERYMAVGGYNRTYLLAGTRNGAFCVLDWQNEMQVLSRHVIHEKKSIEAMCVNTARQWLITSGTDNVIKVSYLFPYCSPDILGQLIMSFYCNSLPHFMAVMRTALGVVFHDQDSMTFNFVVYDLHTKLRYDHAVTDDHEDAVTALSSCEKLRLFATSSEDLSVRLWNEKNLLLRHVRIGEVIYSLSFCSEKGDLLIGTGQHVRIMEHHLYLPKFFKKKLLLKLYANHQPIEPLPVDTACFYHLSSEEQDRFNAAHTALKLDALVGTKELSRVAEEAEMNEKRDSLARLAEREREIQAMISGTLKAGHATLQRAKREMGKRIANEAYEAYFREVAKFGSNTLTRKIVAGMEPQSEPPKNVEESPFYEVQPNGFFPNSKQAKRLASAKRVDMSDDSEAIEKRLADQVSYNFPSMSQLPRADGSVPNSSLVQVLWPPDVRDEFEHKEKEFRLDMRYFMPESTGSLYRIKSASFVDRERHLSYEDEEPPALLTEILENAAETEPLELYEPETPPPPEVNVVHRHVPKPPSVMSSSSVRAKVAATLPPRRVRIKDDSQTDAANAEELKPVAPPAPEVRQVTPPPPPPPPPRPETPVPDFIKQFAAHSWFVKRFPEVSRAAFPKPWIVEDFFLLLIKIFTEEPDQAEASQILKAVLLLCQTEKIGPGAIRRAEEAVLGKWRDLFPIDPNSAAARELLMQLMRFLSVINCSHREFIKELFIILVEHTETRLRRAAEDMFTLLNLNDPFRMLQKQFDSWDTWKLPDDDTSARRAALDELCDKFLDSCMSQYKVYCNDRIKRLRSLKIAKHVKVVVEPTEPSANKSKHGILKNSTPSNANVDSDQEISRLMRPTYIDAINNYCEVQHRKLVERLNEQRTTTQVEQDDAKRTVVMLPSVQKREPSNKSIHGWNGNSVRASIYRHCVEFDVPVTATVSLVETADESEYLTAWEQPDILEAPDVDNDNCNNWLESDADEFASSEAERTQLEVESEPKTPPETNALNADLPRTGSRPATSRDMDDRMRPSTEQTTRKQVSFTQEVMAKERVSSALRRSVDEQNSRVSHYQIVAPRWITRSPSSYRPPTSRLPKIMPELLERDIINVLPDDDVLISGRAERTASPTSLPRTTARESERAMSDWPPLNPKSKPLVRLGETHCSVCKPHRETNYSTDFYRDMLTTLRGRQPFPGDMNSFTQCVALPMPVCSLQLVTDSDKQTTVNTSLRPLETDSSLSGVNLINATLDLLSMKLNRNKYFLPSISHI